MRDYEIKQHFKKIGDLPLALASKTSVCVGEYVVELRFEDQSIRITKNDCLVKNMNADCDTDDLHGFVGKIWGNGLGFRIHVKRKDFYDRLMIVECGNSVWAEVVNKAVLNRHQMPWLQFKYRLLDNQKVHLEAVFGGHYLYIGIVVSAIIGSYCFSLESSQMPARKVNRKAPKLPSTLGD